MTAYLSSLAPTFNGADKWVFWLLVAWVIFLIYRRPSSSGRLRWLRDVWAERDLWTPAAIISTIILSGFFGFLIWRLWPIIRCNGVGK